MNPEALQTLEGILAKDKNTLTDGEKSFLRARASYLNDEQQKRFADVLEGVEIAVEDEDEGEAVTGDALDGMTVAELKALAEEEGIELESSKKADIIAEIKQVRTESEADLEA